MPSGFSWRIRGPENPEPGARVWTLLGSLGLLKGNVPRGLVVEGQVFTGRVLIHYLKSFLDET